MVSEGYLVSVCVSPDDDGFDPAGHQTRDVLTDDGLPEHSASKDVPDGSIGRTPHLLQLELFHAILVWRDGRALDAHVVPPHCLRRLNRDIVVGGIARLHAKVKARGHGDTSHYIVTNKKTLLSIKLT